MESTGTEPRGDRGQLIIVISLVLATLFVALALILNSGIYAENLSTRETTDSSDVSLTIQQVDRETREAMRAANRIEESQEPSDAIDNFTASFDAVSVAVANERALRGQALDMNRTDTSGGYSLQQDNATRNYTDNSGEPDWTLASDVERMAGVRFAVNRTQLNEDPGDVGDLVNETFTVEFADENGDEWLVFIYREDDNVTIAGDNRTEIDDLYPDGDIGEVYAYGDDCKVETETAQVDFAGGTIEGTPCPALEFGDELSENLTVSFNNADKAGGTYLIVVSEGTTFHNGFNEPTDSPYRAGAVFDASVDVTFERSDARYSTSRTVTAEPLAYEAE